MKLKAVVDRTEGEKAVLLIGERQQRVNWPIVLLPKNWAEGDILRINISIDEESTKLARIEAEDLLRQVLDQSSQT